MAESGVKHHNPNPVTPKVNQPFVRWTVMLYVRAFAHVLNIYYVCCLFVCLMVFNATFNNISVISWRSVLLVEETVGPEKTTDLSQVPDKLYHIMLYTSPWSRFELTTSVMVGTDCIGSCQSNYHAITTTTVPILNWLQAKKYNLFLKDHYYKEEIKIITDISNKFNIYYS